MEKFSFYDLLAVLFPGAIGLYLVDAVRQLYGICPDYSLTDKWEVVVILSVMMGGLIYRISFGLTRHANWFYQFTGLYRPVSELYFSANLHSIAGDTLNRQAQHWYGRDIFFAYQEYNELLPAIREKCADLQDEFYDRMYYQLEFDNKLSVPKAFQSFYLFFRNAFLTSVLAMLLLILLYLLHLVPGCTLVAPTTGRWLLHLTVIMAMQLSMLSVARWYRQRMVLKMYWYFYIYLANK